MSFKRSTAADDAFVLLRRTNAQLSRQTEFRAGAKCAGTGLTGMLLGSEACVMEPTVVLAGTLALRALLGLKLTVGQARGRV